MIISISNTQLLDELIKYLEEQNEVGAVWLEGSFARGESDEFSDIDLWLDCKNGLEKDLLVKILDFLKAQTNSKIQIAHNYFQDHPEIFQNYIFVDSVIIDLVIQSRSRTKKVFFAKNEEVKILFDKSKYLQFSEELHLEKYSQENLEKSKQWILAKSKAIINKANRGDFLTVCGVYFNLLEDILEFYLSKKQTKKSYWVFKDAKFLDLDDKIFLENIFKVKSTEEIISNLNQIQNHLLTN